MSPVVSIIVPFGYRQGDAACVTRLLNAVRCFESIPGTEVIVFDAGSVEVSGLKKQLLDIACVHYFYEPGDKLFSSGETRNKAVEQARGDYILFFDADLLCTQQFAFELLERVKVISARGIEAFEMYPCLYLSKSETDRVKHSELNLQSYECLDSYLQGYINRVDGIAVASSCVLMNKAWFHKLGGFRSVFKGHGGQDFDLIHRMVAYFPIGKKAEDYAVNVKHQFPYEYQGFRRYYSYYSLPHLFSGRFFMHQWHSRPLTKKYHRKHTGNAEMLNQALRHTPEAMINDGRVIEPFSSDIVLPDYKPWIQDLLQSNGFSPEKYCGLFHWQAGVEKRSGGFFRKLRKLMLNPARFFKDMLK